MRDISHRFRIRTFIPVTLEVDKLIAPIGWLPSWWELYGLLRDHINYMDTSNSNNKENKG